MEAPHDAVDIDGFVTGVIDEDDGIEGVPQIIDDADSDVDDEIGEFGPPDDDEDADADDDKF